MSKFYPYIEHKEKITNEAFLCEHCKILAAYTLEYHPTYMQGDTEFMKLCKECLEGFESEIQAHNDRMREREREAKQKQSDFMGSLYKKLSEIYKVKKMTETQWRIDGKIDIYPVNKRYHILKGNRRGGYYDLLGFIKTVIPVSTL